MYSPKPMDKKARKRAKEQGLIQKKDWSVVDLIFNKKELILKSVPSPVAKAKLKDVKKAVTSINAFHKQNSELYETI